MACFLGRLDALKILFLNEYLDYDLASEPSGYTPLILAAMSGYYEIVKILIDAGADVNKQSA